MGIIVTVLPRKSLYDLRKVTSPSSSFLTYKMGTIMVIITRVILKIKENDTLYVLNLVPGIGLYAIDVNCFAIETVIIRKSLAMENPITHSPAAV